MSISFLKQPNGMLAAFSTTTNYFLGFDLTVERARRLGLNHSVAEEQIDKLIHDALDDVVYADRDEPQGLRRWHEIIASLEKDRGCEIVDEALADSGSTGYRVPDKYRRRFGLCAGNSPRT